MSVRCQEAGGRKRARDCLLHVLSCSVLLKSFLLISCVFWIFDFRTCVLPLYDLHHHHHLSLNREGRWRTTDDFTTSFLHFSLFSIALLDLANTRPVHSLMLSSYLFFCLPCLLVKDDWVLFINNESVIHLIPNIYLANVPC